MRFVTVVWHQSRSTPKPEGHQGHGSQLWEVKEGVTEEVTTEFSLGGLVGGHQANPAKEGRKAIGGRDQLRRTWCKKACCSEIPCVQNEGKGTWKGLKSHAQEIHFIGQRRLWADFKQESNMIGEEKPLGLTVFELKELIISQVNSLCSPFSFPLILSWSFESFQEKRYLFCLLTISSLQVGSAEVRSSPPHWSRMSGNEHQASASDWICEQINTCRHRLGEKPLSKNYSSFCSLGCFTGKVCLVCQETVANIAKGNWHAVPSSLLGWIKQVHSYWGRSLSHLASASKACHFKPL